MNANARNAQDANAAVIEANEADYDAGWNWAYDLKVGQDFRGSHGEAAHRGLGGDRARAFQLGAMSGLEGWKGIYTQGHSIKIVKLEAK